MTASAGPWRKFALIDQLCSFNSSCVIVTGRYPRGPIKSRRIPRRSTAKVLPFSLMYVFGSHALVSCETSFISIPLRETWPNLFPVGNVLSLLVSLSLYVYFFRFFRGDYEPHLTLSGCFTRRIAISKFLCIGRYKWKIFYLYRIDVLEAKLIQFSLISSFHYINVRLIFNSEETNDWLPYVHSSQKRWRKYVMVNCKICLRKTV